MTWRSPHALGSPRSGPRAAEGDRWPIAVTSMNFRSSVLRAARYKVTACTFPFCEKLRDRQSCSGRKRVCGCLGAGGAGDDCRAVENIRGPRKCAVCCGCGRGYRLIIGQSSLNQYVPSCTNCISSQFFKQEKAAAGLTPSSPLQLHCHSRAQPWCGLSQPPCHTVTAGPLLSGPG